DPTRARPAPPPLPAWRRTSRAPIAPSRTTAGAAPVRSTTLLGGPPPASAQAPPSIETAPRSAPQSAAASARVRAGGAPLRLRLVAVTGPRPLSHAAPARALAAGCGLQRKPTDPPCPA